MAQLRDLLPLIREKANGILDQQAVDQLKKAYRIFCIESGYIQQTETVIRSIDGTVTLYPEIDHYITSINVVIETKAGKELTKGVEYKVDHANNVTILQGFDVVVVTYSIAPVLPMDDALWTNDDVFQRWPDELASGAAALLLRMPKKSWTDFGLSDFYQRDFVKGHREAYKIRVSANDETQFQPFSNRNFF